MPETTQMWPQMCTIHANFGRNMAQYVRNKKTKYGTIETKFRPGLFRVSQVLFQVTAGCFFKRLLTYDETEKNET